MTKEKKPISWFKKNRKWAFPAIGCFSTIIATIIAFTMLYNAMETKVTEMFEDSIPYTVGMKTLNQNESSVTILGKPITRNGKLEGNINYEEEQGTADLKIPVKGPKGEGTLLIIAEKDADNWTYQKLELSFKNSNEVINLLPIDK